MLIKELPDDVKQEIRARLPDHISFESIENLPLNELPRWMAALREDLERRIERKRRRLAVEQEINDLALSVSEKYSDIPLWKVEYFLHGEVRKRFQALMRELDEMSQVPLVTYGRQPWHRAVEDEINLQLNRGLRMSTAWPPRSSSAIPLTRQSWSASTQDTFSRHRRGKPVDQSISLLDPVATGR
jgi:hypothetical protein